MPGKPIEFHATLPDGWPCQLSILEKSFIVKIADNRPSPCQVMANFGLEDPLVVWLANGQIATLSETYNAGYSVQTGREAAFVVREIGANKVMIGPRVFGNEDLVSSILFTPTNEFISEYYRDHRGHTRVTRDMIVNTDQLFQTSWGSGNIIVDSIDEERLTICYVEEGNTSISLRVAVGQSGSAQGIRAIERRITQISYRNPVTLDKAITDAMNVCNFFSFITGAVIAPTAIRIQSGSENEPYEFPKFDLYIHVRSAAADLDLKDTNRCLISQPIDGAAYGESLRRWFCRSEEWQHSYNLACDCLQRQNENGRHRFIDAVNWFESIPQFYCQPTSYVPTEIILQAAGAAVAVFRENGITEPNVTADRLFGLLVPLNSPSLAARLRSALTHIRMRFGQSALPASAEGSLARITKLRGAFSHGTSALESEEAHELYELTLFVELVCGLLTLSGLAWELPRLAQAHFHPVQLASATLSQFDFTRRMKLARAPNGAADRPA